MNKILTNHTIKIESQHSSENEWSRWKKIGIQNPEPGNFIFAKILSQNSFITIFEGDFRCLGEEYTNLIYSNTDNIQIINLEDNYYKENDYKEFSYLIVYEKNNDRYKPKKIIYLVRNEIRTNEVSYVTGKNCELDIDEYKGKTYCSFNFDDIFQISENKIILKYQSKIEADRDQGYYYIIDKIYKNETIYYYLNIQDQVKIEKILFSTDF